MTSATSSKKVTTLSFFDAVGRLTLFSLSPYHKHIRSCLGRTFAVQAYSSPHPYSREEPSEHSRQKITRVKWVYPYLAKTVPAQEVSTHSGWPVLITVLIIQVSYTIALACGLRVAHS